MLRERGFICEASRAQGTLERLFSPVCPLMKLQITLVLKHFPTEATFKLGCLMAPQMFLEALWFRELQPTLLTLSLIFLTKVNLDSVRMHMVIGLE